MPLPFLKMFCLLALVRESVANLHEKPELCLGKDNNVSIPYSLALLGAQLPLISFYYPHFHTCVPGLFNSI